MPRESRPRRRPELGRQPNDDRPQRISALLAFQQSLTVLTARSSCFALCRHHTPSGGSEGAMRASTMRSATSNSCSVSVRADRFAPTSASSNSWLVQLDEKVVSMRHLKLPSYMNCDLTIFVKTPL